MYKLKDYSWYRKWYFPSGEMGIELKQEPYRVPQGVYEKPKKVLQAEITSPDDIIELLLVTNALQQFFRLHLILPYIPFGRQDRHTTQTSPFSLKVFATMVNSMGYTGVTTFDPHSNVSELLIDNLEVYDPWESQKKTIMETPVETVVVAPDAGAEKRAFRFAKFYGIPEVVVASKRRNPATGEILGLTLEGCPKDKHIIVVDDICDGGRTFVELAKVLPKERKSLTLAVSHGIFSQTRKPLHEAGYERIICYSDFIEKRLEHERGITYALS